MTYKDAGVDISNAESLKEHINTCTLSTHNKDVLIKPGLFGGAIRLNTYGIKNAVFSGRIIKSNIENDFFSFGKKLASAIQFDENNIAFLDYISTDRLEISRIKDLISGISEELKQSGIPLIGGETAEMPGIFKTGKWEIVGASFSLEKSQDDSVISSYKKPVGVFSIDGVGTKTMIGVAVKSISGLVEDIISHSKNDIVCQGARALGMLFYIGCFDKSSVQGIENVIRECCSNHKVSPLDILIYEDKECYANNQIDICGSVAGIVEEDEIIMGKDINCGDIAVALPSNGLHTNGYSLARKALFEMGGFSYEDRVGDDTIAELLLRPHIDYSEEILKIRKILGRELKGVAHITGGGLIGNIQRILPEEVSLEINKKWRVPEIFEIIRKAGNIPLHDPINKGMYESFNMGIGIVMIVSEKEVERLMNLCKNAFLLGKIVKRKKERVIFI